jgi:hypothetical protein
MVTIAAFEMFGQQSLRDWHRCFQGNAKQRLGRKRSH